MERIVCEISGGYDSGAALLKTKEMYPHAKIYGFMVNYGQLPFPMEIYKAQKFCKKEGIELKVAGISNLFSRGTTEGGDTADVDGVAKIYTPLRNLVLISMAASFAESIDAKLIITGSKGLNDDGKPYSFRDSVLPFYELMNGVLNYAAYKPIKILPILMHNRNTKMSKKEVFEYLNSKGYGMDDFWNCFNSAEKKCGSCNNCLELEETKEVWK